MFTSDLDRLPPDERIERLQGFESAIKKGEYNPLPECEKIVKYRAKNDFRKTVTVGLPISFAGAIVIGSSLAVPSFFVGVLGAGGLALTMAIANARLQGKLKNIKDGQWGEYLTDDELEKLDDFQSKYTPQTDDAKYAHEVIKQICDQMFDNDDETETVDAKAEEIKDKEEEKEAGNSKGKGAPDGVVKSPNNPTVDEPEYDNPWLKDAKLGESKTAGNSVKKLTLREDGFIDKVDKTVKKSAEQYHQDTQNSISELRHTQEIQGENFDKRMTDQEEKQQEFNKSLLEKFETINKTLASSHESKNAADIGVLRAAANPTHAGSGLESGFAVPPPKDGLKLNFGVFDPETPEVKDEFTAYKWAVEYEDLKPRGNPILNRIWGVTSGGSKKCTAARTRRDQFASRMEDFGDFHKLYGE